MNLLKHYFVVLTLLLSSLALGFGGDDVVGTASAQSIDNCIGIADAPDGTLGNVTDCVGFIAGTVGVDEIICTTACPNQTRDLQINDTQGNALLYIVLVDGTSPTIGTENGTLGMGNDGEDVVLLNSSAQVVDPALGTVTEVVTNLDGIVNGFQANGTLDLGEVYIDIDNATLFPDDDEKTATSNAENQYNKDSPFLVYVRLNQGGDGAGVFADGNGVVLDELFLNLGAENLTALDVDDDGYSSSLEVLCDSNPFNVDSTCDDLDGDGYSNEDEESFGTDPRDPSSPHDNDGDSIPSHADLCPDDFDPDQTDIDNDGIGDWCDDDDGDGLSYAQETNGSMDFGGSVLLAVTDPDDPDSDGDGINDRVEQGLRQAGSAPITNLTALDCGGNELNPTDPNVADTDGDRLSDGDEHGSDGCWDVDAESDPNSVDTDGDLIDDQNETLGRWANGTVHGFGPTLPYDVDSDGDGLNDTEELEALVNEFCFPEMINGNLTSSSSNSSHPRFDASCTDPAWTDPNTADSDGDGLDDGQEANAQNNEGDAHGFNATDPLNADTDGDGATDGDEVNPQYLFVVPEADVPIPDPTAPAASDPNDDGSRPEEADPVGTATGLIPEDSPLGLLIGLLIPECRDEDPPGHCDDPTDQRDSWDSDGEDGTNHPNGQIDLVEEHIVYTRSDTNADLDVTVLTPSPAIGSTPDPLFRVVVGDRAEGDGHNDLAAAWVDGMAACVFEPESFDGPAGIAYIGQGSSIEDACGAEDATRIDANVTTVGGSGVMVSNGGTDLLGFHLNTTNIYSSWVHLPEVGQVVPISLVAEQDDEGNWTISPDPTTCAPDPDAGLVCDEDSVLVLPGQDGALPIPDIPPEAGECGEDQISVPGVGQCVDDPTAGGLDDLPTCMEDMDVSICTTDPGFFGLGIRITVGPLSLHL